MSFLLRHNSRYYMFGGAVPPPPPVTFTYTGEYTERTIEWSNHWTNESGLWKEIALLTDGTLEFSRPIYAPIWMCSGGSNGLDGYAAGGTSFRASGGEGGAGGDMANVPQAQVASVSKIDATIAPANTAVESSVLIYKEDETTSYYGTSIGPVNSKNGGFGGGGSGGYSKESGYYTKEAGTGTFTSTLYQYPFYDRVNHLPHCVAGGGGSAHAQTNYYSGGNGGGYMTYSYDGKNGTQGSAGRGNTNTYLVTGVGGSGNTSPTNATVYGGGGGGGGAEYINGNISTTQGGAGKQGVIYVRYKVAELEPAPLCITALTEADPMLYVDNFVEGTEPFQIQAKVNDGNWETFVIDQSGWSKYYNLEEGDKLYIRGNNDTFNSTSHGRFRIGTHSLDYESKVSLSGDITSLLNGKGGVIDLTPYGDRTFRNLFDNSNNAQGKLWLVSIHELKLPSRTTAEYAYSNMFRAQSNLVDTPNLIASALGASTYNYTFNNCPALTDIYYYGTTQELGTSVLNRCWTTMEVGTFHCNYLDINSRGENTVPYNFTIVPTWVTGGDN